MTGHSVYISIGSNMEDPLENCRRGIDALCRNAEVALIERSPWYKTQPVDYVDQNWFINSVISAKTRLSPFELLEKTQRIQNRLGRKSDGVRFGPRVIDLDIIFYDDLLIDTAHLVIPHPRMHKRRFVLQPICDIDPTVMHPGLGRNVQELLNQLVIDDQDIQRCFDC
jgi:2-amino-4-hydroxy-6-hydroxymethyldihydropteridine diphosphokinase